MVIDGRPGTDREGPPRKVRSVEISRDSRDTSAPLTGVAKELRRAPVERARELRSFRNYHRLKTHGGQLTGVDPITKLRCRAGRF